MWLMSTNYKFLYPLNIASIAYSVRFSHPVNSKCSRLGEIQQHLLTEPSMILVRKFSLIVQRLAKPGLTVTPSSLRSPMEMLLKKSSPIALQPPRSRHSRLKQYARAFPNLLSLSSSWSIKALSQMVKVSLQELMISYKPFPVTPVTPFRQR